MKYLTILFLFILSSCRQEIYDLGGYSINYDSRLDKNIILDNPKGGAIICYWNQDSIFTKNYFKNTAIVIDAYVAEAKADTFFIIVDQKPLDRICECNDSCLQNKYKNWNDLPTYKMCEEGIEKSTIHSFYIIDKKRSILFGPMSLKQFNYKRKELNVSKKLKLGIEIDNEKKVH